MREPIKVSGEACNLGLYTCEVLMKCLTLIKFTLSTKKTHNIPKWDISAECGMGTGKTTDIFKQNCRKANEG